MPDLNLNATTTNTITTTIRPKSAHVSEPFLQPFLQPSFDPISYLNDALPSLSFAPNPQSQHASRTTASASTSISTLTTTTTSTSTSAAAAATPSSLTALSAQTQALISQLNAHTSRLSNTLTQLTDDILRSGGRLAYEVEVLRGETLGLSDALTDGLKDQIAKFLPEGVGSVKGTDGDGTTATAKVGTKPDADDDDDSDDKGDAKTENTDNQHQDPTQPAHIAQLRLLTQVRARLESVIRVFGDAMQWTLPPSETSLASSLISVSAPEVSAESRAREDKAREFAARLEREIAELVTGDGDAGDEDDDGQGTEKAIDDAEAGKGKGTVAEPGLGPAMARIQALRDLARVWKGTAEEKARIRFVEGLVKIAEQRYKAVQKSSQPRQQRPGGGRGTASEGGRQARSAGEGGYGFLGNLQRMTDGIYLE